MVKRPEQGLSLSPDDFEFDEDGNLRIKRLELAEELLRLLVRAKPAQKAGGVKGPRVKVEM